MTQKHTFGRLHLDADAEKVGGCRSIYAADGSEIACTSGLHDDIQDLANARLFAAAPEMLAALEAICGEKGIGIPLFERLNMGFAAIAKASGSET